MIYTTVENIRRRLRGRLEIDNTNLIPSATAQQVDQDLITQVGEQIEAKINLALSQIYSMPIPLTAVEALKIIEGIVEKLIISEIATVHFQQTQSPELGGDAGFGAVLRKQAVQDLESLLHGHGIYIPGLMEKPQPNAMTGIYNQPLVLPGVDLKLEEDQADTFTRSYSFLEKRELTEKDNPFDFSF